MVDSAPLASGFFVKEGGSVRTWKRRWFALDHSLLSYSPRSDKQSWVKSIAVSNISKIVSVDECSCRWPARPSEACFGVVTPKRTFHFLAESIVQGRIMQSTLALLLISAGTLNDGGVLRCLELIEKHASSSDAVRVHLARLSQKPDINGLLNCKTSDKDCNDTRLRILKLVESSAEEPTNDTEDGEAATTEKTKDEAASVPASNGAAQGEEGEVSDAEAKPEKDGEGAQEDMQPAAPASGVHATETEEGSHVQQDTKQEAEADQEGDEERQQEQPQEQAQADAAEDNQEDDGSAKEAGDAQDQVSEQPAPSSWEGAVSDAAGHGRKDDSVSATDVLAHQEAEAAVAAAWQEIGQQMSESSDAQPYLDDTPHWQEVRVFVSSTFADMYAEREQLVRKVFPRLKVFCQERMLRLVSCDLRWGVPKESSPEVVFRTCLRELDRCREANINPFFINLLGERYGWVPTKEEVPGSVRDEYDWVDDTSITHMEILHGALRTLNPNAAFFLRGFGVVDEVPDDFRSKFIDDSALAREGLRRLKSELRRLYPEDRVFDYTAHYKETRELQGIRKPILDGLDDFADRVYDFLSAAIEKQYPVTRAKKPMTTDLYRARINDLLTSESETVIGRDEEVRAILEYCRERPEEPVPHLAVAAHEDDGRDGVMALAALKAREQGMNVIVIKNLDNEQSQLLNRVVQEAVDASSFKDFIQKAQDSEAPVVVFLMDGADSGLLRDDDRTHLIKSAKALHFVLAQAPAGADSLGIRTLTESHLNADHDKKYTVTMSPLSREAARAIVQLTLARYNKRLDEEQMNLLVSNEGARQLSWLRCACEELRVYGVFETLTARIRSLPADIADLSKQILARVAEEDDSGKLVDALLLLVGAKGTLRESEFREMLGSIDVDDDGEKVKEPMPAVVWLLLLDRIDPLITIRGDEIRFKNWEVCMAVLEAIVASKRVDLGLAEDVAFEQAAAKVLEPSRNALFDFFKTDPTHPQRSTMICAIQAIALKSRPMAYHTLKQLSPMLLSQRIAAELGRLCRCDKLIHQLNRPGHERMCVQCGHFIKLGLARKDACGLCGQRVPFAMFRLGDDMKEARSYKPAYRCRDHTDFKLHMPNHKGPQNCFHCKRMVMKQSSYPVLLCQSCTFFNPNQPKCCELLPQ